MKATKNTIGLVSTLTLTLLLGCSEPVKEKDQEAPDFAAVGQEEVPEAAYAPGPYGFEKGKIIPNLEFIGYPNFLGGSGLTWMSLADFYNPTGTEVYPEGSLYGAGSPKPRALLVIMGAAWCPPCKQEAAGPLPDHYAIYKDQGGQFLSLIVEATDTGPADYATATSWADAYDIDYALGIDPTAQMMTFFEAAFPGNMIVRTRDMKIIESISGSPQEGSPQAEAFWGTYEDVMNGVDE